MLEMREKTAKFITISGRGQVILTSIVGKPSSKAQVFMAQGGSLRHIF
jgi:hypothetical protein